MQALQFDIAKAFLDRGERIEKNTDGHHGIELIMSSLKL